MASIKEQVAIDSIEEFVALRDSGSEDWGRLRLYAGKAASACLSAWPDQIEKYQWLYDAEEQLKELSYSKFQADSARRYSDYQNLRAEIEQEVDAEWKARGL